MRLERQEANKDRPALGVQQGGSCDRRGREGDSENVTCHQRQRAVKRKLEESTDLGKGPAGIGNS